MASGLGLAPQHGDESEYMDVDPNEVRGISVWDSCLMLFISLWDSGFQTEKLLKRRPGSVPLALHNCGDEAAPLCRRVPRGTVLPLLRPCFRLRGAGCERSSAVVRDPRTKPPKRKQTKRKGTLGGHPRYAVPFHSFLHALALALREKGRFVAAKCIQWQFLSTLETYFIPLRTS